MTSAQREISQHYKQPQMVLNYSILQQQQQQQQQKLFILTILQ